jgi:tRNA wybutosine-synthesizing protein 4
MDGSQHHRSHHLDEEDSAVRGTNDEATVGKLSAVSKGYYEDAFISAFGSKRMKPLILSPLMNRGHFARSVAIETVARRFLQPVDGWPERRQIVSLGCGFDTLYFRLCSSSSSEESVGSLHYFEIDFEQVVRKKQHVFENDARFAPLLNPTRYSLLACDLRNAGELTRLLGDKGFETQLPTLFISECALIYMSADEGTNIIRWAAHLTHSVFCTYEQIRPHDAFGKTMIRNLEQRNIPLHSLLTYPDLVDQEQRYLRDAGFVWATARTMLDVFDHFIPKEIVRKACQIEFFDEFEEWNIVLSHYCLVLAGKDEAVKKVLQF